MTYGESIRIKREEYDLEQQELAQRAGISKSLLCAIEKGQRLPSLMTTIAIADALHCSIDELLGRKAS